MVCGIMLLFFHPLYEAYTNKLWTESSPRYSSALELGSTNFAMDQRYCSLPSQCLRRLVLDSRHLASWSPPLKRSHCSYVTKWPLQKSRTLPFTTYLITYLSCSHKLYKWRCIENLILLKILNHTVTSVVCSD